MLPSNLSCAFFLPQGEGNGRKSPTTPNSHLFLLSLGIWSVPTVNTWMPQESSLKDLETQMQNCRNPNAFTTIIGTHFKGRSAL